MLDSSTDLSSLLKDPSLLATKAFSGGEWVDAADGATYEVRNPARGDVIALVADLSRAEVAEAIEAARIAQIDWAARTAKERANIMRRFFDLMIENQDDLATILTAEMGKPLAEAKGEIAYGASFIEFFAKRPNESTARPSRVIRRTSGSPSSSSRSVLSDQSRPGISRTR